MINNLHHFEILTNSSSKLLSYFMKGFKFNLVMTKETDKFREYLLDLNSMRFLITSLKGGGDDGGHHQDLADEAINSPIYQSSLKTIESRDRSLFETIRSKSNTVFNAAFQVKDLDRILFNCQKFNVPVLKQKHMIYDDYRSKNGHVQSAIIKSCVDGVVHSIFDLNDYKGRFLPGYETGYATEQSHNPSVRSSTSSPITHFDHLTYATYKDQSVPVIDWYKNVFNMRRFKIEREENGLIVRTGRSGMNIKAINYWLCGETGVELEQSASKDFKFVISEPQDDQDDYQKQDHKSNCAARGEKNQIAIFLDEHNGPGIQHIGLHTCDIVESVRSSKGECDNVSYYATPDSYYNNSEKKEEINECGLDVELLKQNHILLDAEFEFNRESESKNSKSSKAGTKTGHLLQVFTQPLFDKNTLFLELIQRVGNAQGFGAGNIKALWNAVQLDINQRAQRANI